MCTVLVSCVDFEAILTPISTLGSRGYFFLIDISWRSRVNEAQSAEEKKIASGHRSTQSHFHARSSSEIELGHRLDTPM